MYNIACCRKRETDAETYALEEWAIMDFMDALRMSLEDGNSHQVIHVFAKTQVVIKIIELHASKWHLIYINMVIMSRIVNVCRPFVISKTADSGVVDRPA